MPSPESAALTEPPSDFACGLYIVATPIGNLSDISMRQIALLKAADVIAVEDSRVTGKLLHHLGIKGKMRPYHDHSGQAVRDDLLAAARHGVVALVSDAGTPLISDPGYKLVRSAHEAGIYVTTAPGPSAAVAALTLSGLPSDRFLFEGFLPSKTKARSDALAALKNLAATLVFYESGPRLAAMLADALDVLGTREAAVVREITKKFEEVRRGNLVELTDFYAQEGGPKGEIVVIIGPPDDAPEAAPEAADLDQLIIQMLGDQPVSKIAGELSKRFDLDRKAVYERASALKKGA